MSENNDTFLGLPFAEQAVMQRAAEFLTEEQFDTFSESELLFDLARELSAASELGKGRMDSFFVKLEQRVRDGMDFTGA